MNIDRIVSDSLKLLGLEIKEVKFFEACLELGPATINEVAKKAHLQRSTAYLIAQQLISKGFLEEDLCSYKKKVSVMEPKSLLRILSSKQRSLRRQELELQEALPSLEAVHSTSQIKPRVRVFEGSSGLLKIWQDILLTQGEILLWTNQQTENLVFGDESHDKFIKERVERGIKIKVLAVNNPQAIGLKKQDSENLRETKILPQETNFSAETYIYDNKVAILDYNKDIIGVLIESGPISSAQKAIFNLTWGQLV